MEYCESIIDRVNGTSVRKVDVAPGVPAAASGGAFTSLSRAERVAELRSRMAQIGGEVPEQDTRVVDDVDVLGLGEKFQHVLPGGGLPRKSVTHMSDTPALVVEMLEQVVASGGYAGVVGWPELSYAALPPDELERIIAVPDPGADPLGVASVLVEGLDLVVWRSPAALELSPVRARPLLGKLRKGRAALMLVGATVPSPALTVSGQVCQFRGIGKGSGRITGLDIRVRAQAKGARTASAVIAVGRVGSGSVAEVGARADLVLDRGPALKVVE